MQRLLGSLIVLTLTQVAINVAVDCSKIPIYLDNEECCKAPDITDRVLYKQCEDDAQEKNLDNGSLICFLTECYMNRAGLIEYGQISLTKVKRFLESREGLGEPQWIELYKEAVMSCFQRTYNKNVTEIQDHLNQLLDIDPGFYCDTSLVYFTNCVESEVLMKCPMSVFNNSSTCTKLQKFLNDCPDYLMSITEWEL